MLTYERTKSGIAKKWEFIYYADYINNEGFFFLIDKYNEL